MQLTSSTYKVIPGRYPSKISVPTSKSYGNRLLVLGALSPNAVTIRGLSPSTDVLSMINALEQLGLEIQGSIDSGELIIVNSFPECERKISGDVVVLETGDGGTTNRFLLGLLALGTKKYQLKTTGRMKERPSKEFFETLRELGVSLVEREEIWCQIQGPVNFGANRIEVDCSRSTQFATALQLALSNQGVEVIPVNMRTSAAYWEMTQSLIEKYQGGMVEFQVPVDFSSLTYPLALGACAGSIEIPNCFEKDPYQADSAFIDMLITAGVDISISKDGLCLKRIGELEKPLNISIAQCPDLTPTLAFLCALIDGKSVIRDVEVLRHKESDRAQEIGKVLKAMGVVSHYDDINEVITIEGPWKRPQVAIDLDLPDDHRIIMMGYLFLNAAGGGTLSNATHVEKSFPSFYKVMGGN